MLLSNNLLSHIHTYAYIIIPKLLIYSILLHHYTIKLLTILSNTVSYLLKAYSTYNYRNISLAYNFSAWCLCTFVFPSIQASSIYLFFVWSLSQPTSSLGFTHPVLKRKDIQLLIRLWSGKKNSLWFSSLPSSYNSIKEAVDQLMWILSINHKA